ncbi:hypothetical protein KHO57_gp147 [Mycobacterium phage Phabba]|uniref:VWFA domain-containing protein n=1 Tax=Mycobacterium phage Phabba TaxID=2027899 RepID=A0A249XSN9_9CAUD|nr:hypothetical protein KHO57_gp147 [Mycobacterium phage Phabba]ASZ74757.1 hypothetical protein SEA_PHABBA_218 [Mycobacterium phage Phabba]
MTDKNKTLIAALLDRSGSMRSRARSTEEGFNELINGQKAEPGTARVTLAQFDDVYEVVYANKPIDEVPPLSLVARSMTALNDGIGKLVTDVGAELAALPEDDRPGLVICVIMTDGMENASREWTAAQIKDLIKEQETTYGWKFIFLGSGIDVQQEGVALRGFGAQRSMAFDADAPVAVAAAYAGTSNLISSYRGMASAGASMEEMDAVGYTDEDRRNAMGAGKQDGESQDQWKSRLKGRSLSSSSR